MSKTIFIVGAIALLTAATLLMRPSEKHVDVNEEVMTLWKDFKTTYNKKYSNAQEQMYRLQVFLNTLNHINENQGETYTLGITEFADLTQQEFVATYLRLKPELHNTENVETESFEGIQAPTEVNWVTKGNVPAVLNQGSCGSCWAFSAAGAMSINYNIKQGGNGVQLSPEQLVQCSQNGGNNGCNGGVMNSAFAYAQSNGLNTNVAYPYTSGNGVTGSCNSALASKGTYKVSSYTNVSGTTSALQNAIALKAVSVGVDATNWSSYKSGVFTNCAANVNHGVIAVGYTSSYWLVRNSWGTGWGQNGYIQLALGNTCGIFKMASYPNV